MTSIVTPPGTGQVRAPWTTGELPDSDLEHFADPIDSDEEALARRMVTGRLLAVPSPEYRNPERLKEATGLEVASTQDLGGAFSRADVLGVDGILLSRVGVVVLDLDPDRRAAVAMSSERAGQDIFVSVEEERLLFAACPDGGHESEVGETLAATWGLQAVGVPACAAAGRGVRVAILDIGLDWSHPDFSSRAIEATSFVPLIGPLDTLGHGTHCAGIAVGPERPAGSPRYGVAPEAELYIGRVLDEELRAEDGAVLAGINWAIEQGCQVVSLCLAEAALSNEPYLFSFEQAAQLAMRQGTVIVAAVGNNSRRPTRVRPLSHPASCPSIVGVAAVDESFEIARSTNAGADIAAPGVGIQSSWLGHRYRSSSGTSAAVPFVVGVLALLAELDPTLTASDLIERLLRSAEPLPDADAGAGLVRAP